MPTQSTQLAAPAALSDTQLSTIRTALEQERRARADQIEELAADAADAVAIGDDARLQVTRVLSKAAEAALVEISAALARLDDGNYGACESCDKPIPVERLEVLPTSRYCTPCQSRAESRRHGRGRSAGPSSWPVAGPPTKVGAGRSM